MRSLITSAFWASRPVSWINTAYPFGAAYLLVTREFSWTLVLGSLFFLIPYNLLMYGVNDVFDYETDVLNPRKGGIEGAKHMKERLRGLLITVLVISLPSAAAMLLLGSLSAKLIFILDIFLVLAYSLPKLRFKERPFIDSITSSCHFTGPLMYALVLSGWRWSYLPFVIALFLWGMASHAYGAVQDIVPDRAAGIGSIATVIGAGHTVWFAAVMYLASFVILIPKGPGPALAGVCNLLYIANVLPYRYLTDETSIRANAGWKRFIWLNLFTGFVITLILIETIVHS